MKIVIKLPTDPVWSMFCCGSLSKYAPSCLENDTNNNKQNTKGLNNRVTVNRYNYNNYCAVPETISTPPEEEIGISEGCPIL